MLYRTILTLAFLAAAGLWTAALTRVPTAVAAQAMRTIYHHVTINGHPVVCSEQIEQSDQSPPIPFPKPKPKPPVGDRNRVTNAETLRLNREELTRLDARLAAFRNDRNKADYVQRD